MTAVDWDAMQADPTATDAVAALATAAAGFDTGVPVVLLPVRLETRFTAVEVADRVDHLADLLAALTALRAAAQALASRSYATQLSGTVKEKKEQKDTVETPLYDQVEADLASWATRLDTVRTVLTQPIIDGTPTQRAELASLVGQLRADAHAARTALAGLRSPYQRARLTALLDGAVESAEDQLGVVEQRVLPTLRMVEALRVRPGARVARDLGFDRQGTPLRVDAVGSTVRRAPPPSRVVRADGTRPAALGARRTLPIDHRRLADSAERAHVVTAALADPTTPLDADLRTVAAGIALLPGATKAELLAGLDAAPARRGAAALRAQLAAVPSDRADLDAAVPGPVADTVFTVADAVRIEHRLLVRIYPEPLAVDTHEEALTDTERAAGTAFWTETSAAGADERLRLGAWRALCTGRSTRRAAWIATTTEPAVPMPTPGAVAAQGLQRSLIALTKRLGEINPADPRPVLVPTPSPGVLASIEKAFMVLGRDLAAAPPLPIAARDDLGERLRTLDAVVNRLRAAGIDVAEKWQERLRTLHDALAAIAIEDPPTIAPVPTETRTATWTRAASSTVLPDRFAVVTVSGGRVSHLAAGAPLPADLALSLDPSSTDSFTLDGDTVVVPEAIRWMVDLDEALDRGMAVSITITADEAAAGFDELFVIGLSAGSPAEGAERLTAMLDNHHYTAEGLALLPVGTATNNTEVHAAGYTTTDDADDAYPIERGASLLDARPDPDGRRLATALGVEPTRLSHVRGADGHDAHDALVANRAFYPGTLGHALEELTLGVTSVDARDRVRAFALAHVVGRGLLPAIRVADQPYGMLPAVALSRFQPDASDTGQLDLAEGTAQLRFDRVLVSLLRQLHADWTALRVGDGTHSLVKHAHSPEVGQSNFDAQAHFLEMLGLQAGSVAAGYRFAVNVANRGGVRGHPELSLGFGVPSNSGAGDAAALFGPFVMMERFADTLRLAYGLPADPPRDHGKPSLAWVPTYDRLAKSRAYGLRLLRGRKPLLGAVADDGTGSALTALLAASAETLTTLGLPSAPRGVPLAEMLVRQALLAELRRAAIALMLAEQLANEESLTRVGESSQYQWSTLFGFNQASAWSLLFAQVDQLNYRLGLDFSSSPFALYLGRHSLSDYLAARGANPLADGFAGHAAHAGVLASLTEHAAAVAELATLPAPRVDALVREHLDTCSYRLDAWLTGLAERRLASQRRQRPIGAQLGAYGYLERLRPAPAQRPATGVPPALAGRPDLQLMADPSSEGFIQAPSPTHAVTAAILRSAYRSQVSEAGVGNEMSVNLSSARVRTALAMIDGVRAGNDLGALLGYRLERYLHEYYARSDTPHVVELDSVIGPLRRAYPTVAGVDPDADAANAPERFVVDGLALVRTLQDWVRRHRPDAGPQTLHQILRDGGAFTGHPWDVPTDALPDQVDTDRLDGVLRGVDAIADALDALGDLTTSEAVHQIVRGNHSRAAAVLAALAEGKAPPPPEIAVTPRTGLPVTHRVLLQLQAVDADPVVAPAGWEAVPITPRAALEPALNAWLAELLGDPASIRVRLRSTAAPDASGELDGTDGPDRPSASPLPEVSVADLGLQPLDLLALMAGGFESSVATLTALVLDHRRPTDLEPDQPGVPTADGPDSSTVDRYDIETGRAPAWRPSIRSIGDVAALLESAADLVGHGRPATAADYAAPEVTAAAGTGIDTADLSTRVDRLLSGAAAVAVTLARLLAADSALDDTVLTGDPAAFIAAHEDVHLATDGGSRQLRDLDDFWAAREQWRAAVVAAAQYGVSTAPPRRFLSRTQVSTELLQAAETAYVELATHCRAAAAEVAGSDPVAGRLAAARHLLGEGVMLIPRVGLDPVLDDLRAALATQLVPAEDLDGWLEGAAAVRVGAARLADVQVLGEALGRSSVSAAVAQLPSIAGEPWLGGPLPDPEALSGRVSVVIYGSDRLPAAGASGTALLVDEWSETVPFRAETTGVALHYDQPDATAPQCVLLAVPPVVGRPWTLADLAATVHDTFEIARNRLVEVEHLGTGLYGQVLPLLVGELVPEAIGSADRPTGARVILDFAQNNPA